MRIVFDTNVYISAIAFADSKSALVFGLASSGAFDLVASEEIVAELVGKLTEPKFGYSEEQLQSAERELRFLVTRPHRTAVRELFYISTVSGGSRRSECLFTAPISCV